VRADLQRALNIRGGGLDDALQDDVALGAREPAAEVRREVCDEADPWTCRANVGSRRASSRIDP